MGFGNWIACAALPVLLGVQTPPKEIQVISEAGPGSIPISDIEGVEMIPLRGIASFVGATVRPGEQGAVTVSANGKLARVSDGRNFVPVEGRLVLLHSPARLVGDEWFVPLDFVTKVLPTLSSDTVTFRDRDRMLVLGSSFPQLQVRADHDPNYTRVVIESDRPVKMTPQVAGDAIRVRIDAPYLRTNFRGETVQDEVVERITLERDEPGYVVTIYLGSQFAELKTPRHPEDALVLDLIRSRVPTRTGRDVEVPWDLSEQTAETEDDPEAPAESSQEALEDDDAAPHPDADVIHLGERSSDVPRDPLPDRGGPQQLRIVTLDPGHGGSATGAKGQNGTLEKQVVLQIARRFRELLQERLGIRVILTRDGDRDLSHDERAAIANMNRSNLFVSIHADASPRRNARGSSVYFLSHTSMPTNASATGGDADLDFILWDMAQTSHLAQSSRLAEILQEELQAVTGAGRVNRGIKQNSFRVLKGATMPAVLVEVGFVSNPEEEKLLTTAAYQDKLAEALLRGVVRYKDLVEGRRSSNRAERSQR